MTFQAHLPVTLVCQWQGSPCPLLLCHWMTTTGVFTADWWQCFAASALTSQNHIMSIKKKKKKQQSYAIGVSFALLKSSLSVQNISAVAEIISVYGFPFPSLPPPCFCSHLFCQPIIFWLFSFYGNSAVTGPKKPNLMASLWKKKPYVKLWE